MTDIPFGLGAVLFVGGYLVFLLGLGYLAKRRRTSNSLSEFYLAGRSLGGFVLFLTLYATQYSGNSLLGYPGEAYRLGFAWLMSVGFMMAIVVVYLIFAPRLYLISRRYHYVTPGDYIKHRFGSPGAIVGTEGEIDVTIAVQGVLDARDHLGMALSEVVGDQLAHEVQHLGAVGQIEVPPLGLGDEGGVVLILGVDIVGRSTFDPSPPWFPSRYLK